MAVPTDLALPRYWPPMLLLCVPPPLARGHPLYVEGRLQYRSWQDEEGKARGVAEIVAADVQFLGRSKDTPPPHGAAQDSSTNVSAPSDEVSADEIPL